jgi:SAM-dependent methyltransferase
MVFGYDWQHKRESLIEWLRESDLDGIEKILEVGAGYGHLSEMVRKQYPDAEVYGLDIDPVGLFSSLCNGRVEQGYAIHGNALNLISVDSPVSKPERFLSLRAKDGEIGEHYGFPDIWKRMERIEIDLPRDFDLIISHDAVPYFSLDRPRQQVKLPPQYELDEAKMAQLDLLNILLENLDNWEGKRDTKVPLIVLIPPVKKGGYILYSLPFFTWSSSFQGFPDFSEEEVERIGKGMVEEAKQLGLTCLGWRIIGDVEKYKQNRGSELNVGILCKRV